MPIARVDFHHHMILVNRAVNGRDLALPERVIKRIIDLTHDQAETGSRVAIDVDIGFQACLLLVGIDIREHGTVLQGLDETRHEGIEFARALALQGELVLGIGRPPAHPDILRRLQIKTRAWHLRELAAQAGDHLVGRLAALGLWLQVDIDRAAIGPRARAGIAFDAGNRRVGLHDRLKLREF